MKMCQRTRTLLMVLIMTFAGNPAIAETPLETIDSAIATADYDRALALITDELVATPGDVALRSRRARVHSYLGNDAAALRDLDTLRRDYPHDVDYAFARAQVFARQGRDDEALDDLHQAAMLAPEYEEVWQLRYALLQRHPDEAMQSEREAVLRDAAARFPDAKWWQSDDVGSAGEWTFVVGAGHEKLNKGLPSWNQQFVQASRDTDDWMRYRLGIARDERFDNADLSLSLGSDIFLASDWSAGLDVTFVDEANFQPDFGYAAYVSRSIQDGWVFTLRYQRREYETATVGSTISTVEKYVGDFRIAYTLGLSHLHGESNFLNHGLTVNWYYSDISSIGLGLNTGEEAESIGPGLVLETEVRGVTLVGRRKISDRLALQWWLGVHDQGEFYRRQYLGMALTIRI